MIWRLKYHRLQYFQHGDRAGRPALLSPGSVDAAAFQRDYWVMLAASVLLSVPCIGRKHRIGHLAGALLLCGFIAYLAVLFFNPFSTFG